MGDTKPVAGHAAVSSVVHRASIADGDNRAPRANSDIICKTEQEVTHQKCCRKQLENTEWVTGTWEDSQRRAFNPNEIITIVSVGA